MHNASIPTHSNLIKENRIKNLQKQAPAQIQIALH